MEKIGYYLLDEMPEPFTNKNNLHYLKLAMEGDKKAREELIKHNLHIISKLVENKYDYYDNKEELFAAGIIGLIRGIDTYKEENKSTFYNYIYNVTDSFVDTYLKKNKLKTENIYEHCNDIDLLSNLEDDYCAKETDTLRKELIRHYLLNLSDRRRLVLQYYFFEGLTLEDIASKLGITHQGISEIIYYVLNKMRRDLANYEKFLKIPSLKEELDNRAILDLCMSLTKLETKVVLLRVGEGKAIIEIANGLKIGTGKVNYIMRKYYMLVNDLKRKNKTLSRQL